MTRRHDKASSYIEEGIDGHKLITFMNKEGFLIILFQAADAIFLVDALAVPCMSPKEVTKEVAQKGTSIMHGSQLEAASAPTQTLQSSIKQLNS
jgi:hypothetical protein